MGSPLVIAHHGSTACAPLLVVIRQFSALSVVMVRHLDYMDKQGVARFPRPILIMFCFFSLFSFDANAAHVLLCVPACLPNLRLRPPNLRVCVRASLFCQRRGFFFRHPIPISRLMISAADGTDFDYLRPAARILAAPMSQARDCPRLELAHGISSAVPVLVPVYI